MFVINFNFNTTYFNPAFHSLNLPVDVSKEEAHIIVLITLIWLQLRWDVLHDVR